MTNLAMSRAPKTVRGGVNALTVAQVRVLAFIREYRRENQMPPTQAEIQRHFGWASPNAVTDHLKALERKGAIRIGANKARAIFDLETI